jgi:hypothetical protein
MKKMMMTLGLFMTLVVSSASLFAGQGGCCNGSCCKDDCSCPCDCGCDCC